MKRLRDLFRPVDRLRYLAWRARGPSAGILEVSLRDGSRLAMRPLPTMDMTTAYELYLGEAYRRPAEMPDRPARVVVDVGANVGYSVVQWARTWPEARVLAFEPHPAHLELLYRHVVANGWADRVLVVGAAAAVRDGLAYLVERDVESVVVDEPGTGRVPIRLCDFFRELEAARIGTIDLLKIDIEGGEYALLEDERFGRLDVDTLVIEWHDTAEHPEGRRWCRERLEALGFAVANGALEYERSGVLWGWRAEVAAASGTGGMA